MGVNQLWRILDNTSTKVNITDDIKDKTLAVDVSIWMVQNENHGKFYSAPKPYLKALFFRSKALLQNGCKLIFVREGDIIQLKQDTMKKRKRHESSQCQASFSQNQDFKHRKRFDKDIDECWELLKTMGLPMIRSAFGEAEKHCAFLNQNGKCDGVITNDGDVFLYGAKCVYRNFCVDKKYIAYNQIEKYEMETIEKKLGYTREMLVFLGLVLGCDYGPKNGLLGCGIETATNFLNELKEMQKKTEKKIDVLNLIRKWSNSTTNVEDDQSFSKYENKLRKSILENFIKTKAMFPYEETIKEYMSFPTNQMSEFTEIEWKKPNLSRFQIFNFNEQKWIFEKSANHLVPLIIQYENSSNEERTILPKKINKIKREKKIRYYEVSWNKMIPTQHDKDLSNLSEYITCEKTDSFNEKFPELVEDFENDLENKKPKKRNKKQTKQVKTKEYQSPMEQNNHECSNDLGRFTLNTQKADLDITDILSISESKCEEIQPVQGKSPKKTETTIILGSSSDDDEYNGNSIIEINDAPPSKKSKINESDEEDFELPDFGMFF